jgi:hypothetical protein
VPGDAPIHFDSAAAGQSVFGNTFSRAARGGFRAVFSHGEHDNLARACLSQANIFQLDRRINPYRLGLVTQLRERFCECTACLGLGQRAWVATLPAPSARGMKTSGTFTKTSQENANG